MHVLYGRVAPGAVWLGIIAFVLCPLLWILALSLQQGPPFALIPAVVTTVSYRSVIFDNARGIGSAILYSLVLSSVATVLALASALAAVYLVIAGVSSLAWRRRIVQVVLSLYFLPSFAVYPGLRLLARRATTLGHPSVQLTLVYYLNAFVLGFVVLLLVYVLSRRSHFDQLLLDTQSRLKAFMLGVVFPSRVATALTAAITFAAVWSDFFLPALITTTATGPKPFSVILQMSMEQYRTEYSTFAAGAVLSLVISLVPTLGFPALAVGIYRCALWLASRRFSASQAQPA